MIAKILGPQTQISNHQPQLLHESWGLTWICFQKHLKNISIMFLQILNLKFCFGCYKTCLFTYLVMFLSLNHPMTKNQLQDLFVWFLPDGAIWKEKRTGCLFFFQIPKTKIKTNKFFFCFLVTADAMKGTFVYLLTNY